MNDLQINTSEWEVQDMNEPTKTVARVPKTHKYYN